MRIYHPLVLALVGACSFSSPGDDQAFTLYRGSPVDTNMRIHVGTFDAADRAAYNRENCELAGQLFKAQPGVTVRYFCEKGRYRR